MMNKICVTIDGSFHGSFSLRIVRKVTYKLPKPIRIQAKELPF